MSAQDKNLRTFRAFLLAGAAASVLAISPSFAQDADDAAEADEEKVVVTGTRIQRANVTAPSPVTTVDASDFSLGNAVNVEAFINTLPQAIPGFDSTSNNPGLGEATVNLRGLGANRTLVLVNNKRFVSSNQNPGVVDLNTIPASLIEQVDIVTGGASAVYGSDAVAGVVNFILKDDFEGLSLDTSYQKTEEGDGAIFNTALTAGTNFDNGRGNVVVVASYTSRESVLQGDREESFVTLVDGGDAGLLETGSVNIPSGFAFAFPDYTAAGVTGAPPCTVEGTTDAGGFCGTDSFGFIFSPEGQGIDPFINAGPNTNRYNYAPANYLQIPQERYSIYGSFNYDVTDNIEAYGSAIWVSSQTEQLLAPTPVFTTLTINLDNPFLAGDQQALDILQQDGVAGTVGAGVGDVDGNGVDDVQLLVGRRMQEIGGRLSDVQNDSFQFQGGFRGDFRGWAWDAFAQFGQANSTIFQTGNVNVPAYQAVVREGRANIFEEDGLTSDIVDEIARIGAIKGTTELIVIGGSIAGDVEQLVSPFASTPVGVAFGVEYQDNSLNAQPDSVLGPDVAGFNQAPAISGSYDVYEVFGEANVPLIEGAPLIEELSLNGAYRWSNYSTVDTVSSYAVGASWTVIEGLRFRGQFQQAVRAPNIGELFQPQVNNFPNIADPCSSGLGSFDDGVLVDQCIENGVPAAAVGTPLQANSQIEGLFGGNPDLKEETADTFTVGLVWEPTFIENLLFTVDYYDIEIEDVISGVPSQTIFDKCFREGVDSFCNLITRFGNGAVDIFESTSQNIAKLNAKGIDVSVDYSYDLGRFGTLGAYSLMNFTDESSLTPLPGDPAIECAGLYGATCGEPTPEFTANTRIDWELGPWAARMRWTYISSVEDDAPEGLSIQELDSYNQVDLTGYWSVNDNVLLSVGVQNLFDTDYVIVGDASAEQSNTYPATYDVFGRTFFGRVVLSY